MDETTPVLADLKKARQGDHVRRVFTEPVRVTIMDKAFDASEVVFTQPTNSGVFWLLASAGWFAATKFEPTNISSFNAWLKQAHPVD